MKHLHTFQQLKENVSTYISAEHIPTIERAYKYARHAHRGQYRRSGTPYITHPVSVAYILSELHQDYTAICAGLLHDTIEDCQVTHDDIEREFGPDVATLVEGVTNLGKIYFGSKEDRQVENFRKMFLAMAKDVRVVLIKLSDRLHNMRTLKFLPSDKQKHVSRETLDIFAPLANRLGIGFVKWELEDLAFYYLHPEEFQKIKRWVNTRRDERESYIFSLMDTIKELIHSESIDGDVTGRPKHFYGIYKKLLDQDIFFEEIYDASGVRILVKSVQDCYQTLGLIHSKFKPIHGRIKDYVAMPKSNLYQSLHTSVIGPQGKPVEIQIRTYDMHAVSEQGIAAHWKYKESGTNQDVDMSWLRRIIDLQQETKAPEEFFKNLKLDLFIDEIFVFTPKGDVQVFPKGSTSVDFAYKIHTDIGNRLLGAKINGHIVNLNYRLKNGDRVEILTSKKESPNLAWLHFAVSGHAKSKIKQWFKKQNIIENTTKGKKELEKHLIINRFVPKEVLTDTTLKKIKTGYSCSKWDVLYLLIGQGDVSSSDIITQLNKLFNKHEDVPKLKLTSSLRTKQKNQSEFGITVLDQTNIEISLAKCCNPLNGDAITGFITIAKGVTVHRSTCSHLINLKSRFPDRFIPVNWESSSQQKFSATFKIEAIDRPGLVQQVLKTVFDAKIILLGVTTCIQPKTGKAKIELLLEVKNSQDLAKIKHTIIDIPDVVNIERSMNWSKKGWLREE
ncbi:bifunctional (p)ppGpp synthetase/guanosine-3',5'-bis(diphosphate) 3'-pyrophosphohydrolase [bacterium]|jgi:GTP diphosphokinase / guanosine-3',5'-bis(diphosphate) 3'-diphosphatase|nr:bifunctional (p)ppGpp synthetase/guanosine-3',5'-bis(diphosphate) 3'-pyrophosphohydrolase [bacterium]